MFTYMIFRSLRSRKRGPMFLGTQLALTLALAYVTVHHGLGVTALCVLGFAALLMVWNRIGARTWVPVHNVRIMIMLTVLSMFPGVNVLAAIVIMIIAKIVNATRGTQRQMTARKAGK